LAGALKDIYTDRVAGFVFPPEKRLMHDHSASTEHTSASTQEIAASAQALAGSATTLERLVSQFRRA
jgi:hypothetical protein